MAAELYADPLVAISDQGIVIRQYSLLLSPKTVSWRDVAWVKAVQPTLWTGRWRLAGTGTFTTWFATDFGRPARETIFIMKLRTQAMKVAFTVHDAARVKQLLAERGVLIDEQGDARPTPLPPETRPLWRWPALHAIVLAMIAFVAQILYFHPKLPATVATHFNFYGNADSWGPKSLLSGAIGVAGLIISISFLAISFGVSRTPAAIFARYLLWFGTATLTLTLAIAHFSFRANLTASQSMGWAPLFAMITYIVVLLAGTVLVIRRLARV
jgi:hypothetical protein